MGRRNGFATGLTFLLALGITTSSPVAQAYTPTMTSAGVPIRWKGAVKLNLVGNPINQNGVNDANFFEAVVRSLQRWNVASGGQVAFDYWQGTDPSTYRPNSEYNGTSSIYFASNAKGETHLTPNVLGLTQVWYNTDTGQIMEADTVLNDQDFYFTTNPKDTSGFGSGSPTFAGNKNSVYIENVITHELGHSLGLSHSGGLQSTMLFMESPEQAHLGCDEEVAIHALYPAPSDAPARGTLAGTVLSESGQPIFGAQVLAISRARGVVLATALTDRAGNYAINALEPGTYYLMVEPFFAGPQALPSYFSGINPNICPNGQAFGRSPLTEIGGFLLHPIGIGPGQAARAPTLTAHCGDSRGAVVSGGFAGTAESKAPVLFDSGSGQSGFGAVDRLLFPNASARGSSDGAPAFYKLSGVSGHLLIHSMSYSLYSPIQALPSLLDANGNEVAAQVSSKVYSGDSGFVDYDTSLEADHLPSGDYYLRIIPSTLDMQLYPAGTVSLDPIPFLVITGSLNEAAPSLSVALPQNARCRMEENFPAYSSPPTAPPQGPVPGSSSGKVGFCAMISAAHSSHGSDGDSGPPGAGAVVGWFLPWILMLGFARASLRHQRFVARIDATS